MKKIILNFILIMTIATNALSGENIRLLEPDMNRGTSAMNALKNRRSTREFADSMLTLRDLSDLMWAANGVNRLDGHHTAPTALNKEDVDVYVLTAEGAYLYNPAENMLEIVTDGDHRALIRGGQKDFPLAPVNIVMVTNPGRFGIPNPQASAMMGAVDVGIVSQNINIFCAANGLVTVPRASMDTDGLAKLLKVAPGAIVLMNNPVGYPAD